MAVKQFDKPLAITRKNFEKAATKIIGRDIVKIYPNPVDRLKAAIYIAFVEQPEKTNKGTKKYIPVLRETAKRIREHGQFTWDKED